MGCTLAFPRLETIGKRGDKSRSADRVGRRGLMIAPGPAAAILLGWRAHHEAWRHSELNQREYCEAQRIPLKAFGNWRAKFKAEPQPPSPKLLYRRRNLSHTLGHSLSHRLSHMTYGSPVQVPSCRRHASIHLDEEPAVCW
jgi:hypothetical protein